MIRNKVLVGAFVVCILAGIVINLQYLKAIIVQVDSKNNVNDHHHAPPPKDEAARHHRPPAKVNNNNNDIDKLLLPPLPSKKVPPNANTIDNDNDNDNEPHKLAGLNCAKHGGPLSPESAAEMVYWRDIPSDADFKSPFADYGPSTKYLTFEPDEGGWNNIRMSMETATVLAIAMGRTLVLPHEQNIYLLRNDQRNKDNNRFTFKSFFHFDSIAQEHTKAVEVISMEEFLQREAMTGQLRDKTTGKIAFPPGNRTVWEGHHRAGKPFYRWLRNTTAAPIWFFDNCVLAFAKEAGNDAAKHVKTWQKLFPPNKRANQMFFVDNPTPVDSTPEKRLVEQMAERRQICIYDDHYQNQKVIHFMGDNASGARLLTHFYAYLFFENWKQDLWTKRFVRDHLRYVDEIQCAAARVVEAVREKARKHGNPDGVFDTFHIRRGDFQYKNTRIEADEILNNTQKLLEKGSTIFIATDEKKKSFFEPFKKDYHVYYLKDFEHLLVGVNLNYMGMLDQLVASRGRTFIGAFFSTFTGYINRMRGYHSQKDKLPGWELGHINSYYYVPLEHQNVYRKYRSLHKPYWAREFPTGWRDIDHDVTPEAFADVAR